MSEPEKSPREKLTDNWFLPWPFLRKLVVVSLCIPPVVLYVVCLQFFYGLFRNLLLDDSSECFLAMAIFVGGFACGLAGFFGAWVNGRPTTIILALLGMVTNTLGFFACVAFCFQGGGP